MELQRALSQISQIHAHVQRSEVFQGYRAVPMAITAAVALAAATVQQLWLPGADAVGFTVFWTGVAAVCTTVCGVDLWWRSRVDDRLRRRLLPVLAQFLPSFAAGAAVTVILLTTAPHGAGRLPGWWALLYGLGVFASRPYLHRATGWVGALYLSLGLLLLALSDPARVPSPWSVGVTFGCGQAALALVLYCAVERGSDDGD